jgi:endonuclease/exonuclease/phosphatase family metal-dependent hydrolase
VLTRNLLVCGDLNAYTRADYSASAWSRIVARFRRNSWDGPYADTVARVWTRAGLIDPYDRLSLVAERSGVDRLTAHVNDPVFRIDYILMAQHINAMLTAAKPDASAKPQAKGKGTGKADAVAAASDRSAVATAESKQTSGAAAVHANANASASAGGGGAIGVPVSYSRMFVDRSALGSDHFPVVLDLVIPATK